MKTCKYSSILKKWLLVLFLIRPGMSAPACAQHSTSFRILALSEDKGHHRAYSARAKEWLKEQSEILHFQIDYLQTTDSLNEKLLSQYQVFLQLDYPPYGWTETAARAFENYIERGKGGWVGFHHASLLGEFDGYGLWNWFSGFMGGIRYKNYIPTFVSAEVRNEKPAHPVMRGLPRQFPVEKEEWYIYNKSPRIKVSVLASVDESTYSPESEIRMGDHPVIWSNEKVKARNVYIFMGHSPALFDNPYYTKLFSNAILWAAGR